MELQIAIAEWTHVQAVIARKSEARLKFRGWLYTLLSAVIIASYSEKVNLDGNALLLLLGFLVLLFLFKEFIIQIEHRKAIARSMEVEDMIRSGKIDVTKLALLSNRMMNPISMAEIKLALTDWRFDLQYVLSEVSHFLKLSALERKGHGKGILNFIQ